MLRATTVATGQKSIAQWVVRDAAASEASEELAGTMLAAVERWSAAAAGVLLAAAFVARAKPRHEGGVQPAPGLRECEGQYLEERDHWLVPLR